MSAVFVSGALRDKTNKSVFCLFPDETLNILLGARSFCKADIYNIQA